MKKSQTNNISISLGRSSPFYLPSIFGRNMAAGMARRKVLVCPVITSVRVSVSIPRDAIVIFVVLRHVQIYLAIPVIERSAAVPGVVVAVSYTEWRRISPGAAVVQCSTGLKVLRTMRVKRIAPIRHGSASIHDIVSVTRAVGLANSTEVDVGVAV